jgi:hypothetical protein
MTWRGAPEVVTEHAGSGGHHRGGPVAFYLREGEGAEAAVWAPDVTSKPLAVMQGKAALKPTGADGYHLLFARRSVPGEEQVALRYRYFPGKPSGRSPTELLQAQLSRLEILPTPLPREHWRFESQPLAGTAVTMVTSNGTFIEEVTDAQGRVEFTLPEDFVQVGSGRAANAPAEFMVSAAHGTDERAYRTTLSADYHVNPAHWESLLGGGIALAAGFACGLVLLRRLPAEGRSA